MQTCTRKLVLTFGIALAVGTAAIVAGDTMSREVIDARQETRIWTTYALSPVLRANDLRVAVHGGKATLHVTVDENAGRELAALIAPGVTGVGEVDNRIVVDDAYVPPLRSRSGERPLGEVIDDATISAAVRSRLLRNPQTSLFMIDVVTRKERVTLKGTVDSPEARGYATGVAANTHGVRSVDNRLMIDTARHPGAVGERLGTSTPDDHVTDSRITTRVESTLMDSDNVDGSVIEVSTSGGNVTLTGKVGSGAERALAIALAQNVPGVKGVRSTCLTF